MALIGCAACFGPKNALLRSPRGCSEPSSRACRVQATPESPARRRRRGVRELAPARERETGALGLERPAEGRPRRASSAANRPPLARTSWWSKEDSNCEPFSDTAAATLRAPVRNQADVRKTEQLADPSPRRRRPHLRCVEYPFARPPVRRSSCGHFSRWRLRQR